MTFQTKYIGQASYTLPGSNYTPIRIQKISDTDFGLVWGEGQGSQWYQAINQIYKSSLNPPNY